MKFTVRTEVTVSSGDQMHTTTYETTYEDDSPPIQTEHYKPPESGMTPRIKFLLPDTLDSHIEFHTRLHFPK